uniref:Gustatory receptor n=1 Tax=Tetranychus urticae TaxID=32264 RepID=T1KQ58_TETUR
MFQSFLVLTVQLSFDLFNKLKMKLFSQWRSFSMSSPRIKLNNLLFGLPNQNLTSEETIEQLVKFERFLIFFRASLGFIQNVSHRSTKTDYYGLIIRAICRIYLIRLICLAVIDDEDYQLYLGDIAYKTKYRSMINVLFVIGFLIGVGIKEWFVLYDKSGKNSVLTIYSDIINHGFEPVHLKMTSNQAIKFHRTIHILVTQLNRNFTFSCLFLAAVYYSVLLFNPHFYQTKEFIFYSLVWSLVAIITIFSVDATYFAIFGYLILIQVYYLFRLESVVELADSYRQLKCTDELASTFIKYTCKHLNQWEKCAKLTGVLVFCVFTAIAFICDLFIFYGFIMNFHSPLFANSFGSIGCIFCLVIACLSLIGREFIIKIERLYSRLHVIWRYNVFNVYNRFKILQLMERLNGPYNGIQLGSITTIGKDFSVRFMLEIGSSLMLLTCNFKRYF